MDSKNQLAILIVQQEDIWKVCDAVNWPDYLCAIHKKQCDKVEAFKLDNFPQKVTITGCLPDDDSRGHYEIDDDLITTFDKDTLITDSEGGMFCCYTDVNNIKEVTKYLKAEWPALEFNVEKEDEGASPFINWLYARIHVEENKLEVPTILDSTILETIKEFDNRIKQIVETIKEFDNRIKQIESEKTKFISTL